MNEIIFSPFEKKENQWSFKAFKGHYRNVNKACFFIFSWSGIGNKDLKSSWNLFHWNKYVQILNPHRLCTPLRDLQTDLFLKKLKFLILIESYLVLSFLL